MEMGANERTRAYDPLRRNKRSIGLNLKDAGAQEAFLKLAEGADVVIEGYRPGVVKRLGVDYETLNKLNGKIIQCSAKQARYFDRAYASVRRKFSAT